MRVGEIGAQKFNQMSNEQMKEFIIRTLIVYRGNYIIHLNIVILLFYYIHGWLRAITGG